MWTLPNYEEEAKHIAQTFVESDGQSSIDELVTKVAQDAQLNPDGVRTLVRLANVCVFEAKMAKSAQDKAEDRMIEFETGDAEQVLTQMHTTVKVASTGRIMDQGYNNAVDFFSDMAVPKPLEKVAEAPNPEASEVPLTSRELVALQFRFQKVAQHLEESRKQSQTEWLLAMKKAAAYLKALDARVSSRIRLEKDATAVYGADIEPELRMLQQLTGASKGTPLYGGIKTATIINTYVPVTTIVQGKERPILEAVKEAREARKKSHLCDSGLKWVEQNVPS